MSWCDFEGEPSDPANQKPLSSIQEVMQGFLKPSASDVLFRNPGSFVAGNVHNHYDTWETILKGYHKQEEVLDYIANGVSVQSFLKPFKGTFKGKPYDSKAPPANYISKQQILHCI